MSRGGARPGAGRPPGNGKKAAPKPIWLFVMHESQNPNLCKVGLTKTNPQVMLSAMQSLNWRPLTLAAVLRVEDRDKASAINRELRARLASLSRGGGWFATEPDRIVAEFHKAEACESGSEGASDYHRTTWGGARPGAGRPRKTAFPAKGALAPALAWSIIALIMR
jgi:hypothetical protein